MDPYYPLTILKVTNQHPVCLCSLPPQVHNFMLGLALNANIPYSPFNEFFCNGTSPEDEVDAVTGEP